MPHENKWSPLDGAHKSQVTAIVTTSELSQFTYPYIMIVQPSSSRVNFLRELYCCWLLSCQLMPRIAIFRLCLPKQFKAMQSTATLARCFILKRHCKASLYNGVNLIYMSVIRYFPPCCFFCHINICIVKETYINFCVCSLHTCEIDYLVMGTVNAQCCS